MKVIKRIVLTSGNFCELIESNSKFISDYYLVTFPKIQGEPNALEVVELLQIGIQEAKRLSLKVLNNQESFTILYSGYSSRREKGWHLHIILVRNRWKKTFFYGILSLKNLLQTFRLREDDLQ